MEEKAGKVLPKVKKGGFVILRIVLVILGIVFVTL